MRLLGERLNSGLESEMDNLKFECGVRNPDEPERANEYGLDRNHCAARGRDSGSAANRRGAGQTEQEKMNGSDRRDEWKR